MGMGMGPPLAGKGLCREQKAAAIGGAGGRRPAAPAALREGHDAHRGRDAPKRLMAALSEVLTPMTA